MDRREVFETVDTSYFQASSFPECQAQLGQVTISSLVLTDRVS